MSAENSVTPNQKKSRKLSSEEARNALILDEIKLVKSLNKPSDKQKLFLELATKDNLSDDEKRAFKTLIKALRAEQRLRSANAKISALIEKPKKEARKARNHELFKSGSLLILADLVDTKTGKPTSSHQELLAKLLKLKTLNVSFSEIEEAKSILLKEADRKKNKKLEEVSFKVKSDE